jgi:S-adenosylmethionine:tRNA-ribosyltransferase-isomerase (queuine synthetase)
VYHEDIRQHDIHIEWAMIDASLFMQIAQYKRDKKPIIAVGTTMMRLLESLPYLRLKLKDIH